MRHFHLAIMLFICLIFPGRIIGAGLGYPQYSLLLEKPVKVGEVSIPQGSYYLVVVPDSDGLSAEYLVLSQSAEFFTEINTLRKARRSALAKNQMVCTRQASEFSAETHLEILDRDNIKILEISFHQVSDKIGESFEKLTCIAIFELD
ncbi:hypothetical protein [Pseudaestuariivita rosea]|uniref:hypothetical protein n=1 Tax=Pseudaestuariivita rosea TaxID=2763263 RepID=UPI001ABA8581|nr:hypothetical protein [Pseudaestuariivita rosea]